MTKKNIEINPPTENTEVPTANAPTTTYTDVALAEECQKRHKSIQTELAKIESSFEKIAFSLYWFYENKGYEQLGYKNIAEFATKEYGFSKATTYNFVNVIDCFGERDENGTITGKIRKEFKNFQSSKLIALLDVSDNEKLKEFTEDMSVRDIKKKIKELTTEDSTTEDSTTEGSTTEDSTTEDFTTEDSTSTEEREDIIDGEITEINRQTVIQFATMEEYNKYLDSMNDLIEKSLKSKAFKDGRHKIEISIVW